MSIEPSFSLYESTADTIKAALGCPDWCAEPARHELDDDTARRAGGIGRLHRSRPVTVFERTHLRDEPLQVHVERWAGYYWPDGVIVDPVVVQVSGRPSGDGLLPHEAAKLAEALAEAAASLSAVTA
ncbi:DUF6907 domain-containing protein [Pseudonocardia halophobica]|uniref:DUF6907 domain-containing protein n=1 Tax=Pseudonocardia halophobica TaxID=29401 RepID=UPI003D8F72D8